MDKDGKANISDTQTATFDFGDVQVVWQHRTWGDAPDPKYPWGATFYGDKGTLKASVMGYDFTPHDGGQPIHKDVTYELDQYPEDKTEKDLEKHVAPAIRGHMKNFLDCIANRGKPGGRHRRRPHLHRQLHPRQHVHGAGAGTGLRPREAGSGRRRGGDEEVGQAVPSAVEAPRGVTVPQRRRASGARGGGAAHPFLTKRPHFSIGADV